MKLKDFDFNSIKNEYSLVGLCVMEEHPIGTSFGQINQYEEGGIYPTLQALPKEWAEREIKETRWYFNIFVIEVFKQ